MENIVTSLSNVISYLREKKLQILDLTDFIFLEDFKVVSNYPLKVKINDNLAYKPIKDVKFNSLIERIAKEYQMSPGFLQDWFLYLVSAIISELETRLDDSIKRYTSELNDIFEKSRKLLFIEENMIQLKKINESIMLPQKEMDFYRQINFNITNKRLSELIYLILEDIDGITFTCLEIHSDILNHIYLSEMPIIYYDHDLEIGSQEIENFIDELTKYHKYCFLREIADNLLIGIEDSTKKKLSDADKIFLTRIDQLLSQRNYVEIIKEILRTEQKRNLSFFSNLFNHFKDEEVTKPFFKDTSPSNYIACVNECYNLKMLRITPNSTLSFRETFRATTKRFFGTMGIDSVRKL